MLKCVGLLYHSGEERLVREGGNVSQNSLSNKTSTGRLSFRIRLSGCFKIREEEEEPSELQLMRFKSCSDQFSVIFCVKDGGQRE